MDASADDPQRYRIRRSPSIGTSANPVGSASARSGKRKLSTAAFASSPSMAPHAPSSPIASEHPTDDLELKLKQGIQGASQVASTSRTTIDGPDAARPVGSSVEPSSAAAHPSASSSHTQFHDWQDQRRCHSVLADYDYMHPAEDRRDPRSSNGRLVMPVSQQPQVMATSPAHDHANSDMASRKASDESSMALQHDRPAKHDACATARSHSGLETSPSLPLSPECRVSPSPSFATYGYPDTPAHVARCLSSSLSQERPSTASDQYSSAAASASPSSHHLTSTAGNPEERAGPTESCSTAHPSPEVSRPWARTTSLRFDETEQSQRLSSALQDTTEQIHDSPAPSQDAFHLQPVPPSKRRRLDDALASPAPAGLRDAAHIDETRRSSDVGIPCEMSQLGKSAQKESNELFESKPTSFESCQRAALVSRTQVTTPASTAAARSLASQTAASVQEADARTVQPAAQASVSINRNAYAEAAQRKHQASSSRKAPRLTRTQSVPNLRAKATLDIQAPSNHRLILPNHLTGYVSRQARGAHYVSKGSSMRPSKGLPLNLAHYSVGPSSSRSRSTFTPTLHPPITRHTLRELDLLEILKNPQLRHDVVFDPNVQFRPNFDGERGRRKREAGERYWTAVVREIESGCTCTAFSHGQLLPCTCRAKDRPLPAGVACLQNPGAGGDGKRDAKTRPPLPSSRIPSRIPLLVQELRTICLSILPSNYPADSNVAAPEEMSTVSSDGTKATGDAEQDSSASEKASSGAPALATTHHQLIAQTLDPHLIAQELQHGVLDVPALITFMGSILKLHCAPMRDEAIERMVEVVCVDRDIGKGLRLCFEILELMKLDIANHQLRSARPFLVETAVDFEIRWFKDQIEQGKMSLDKTTAWMQQALSESSDEVQLPRSEVMIKAFNRGMLQLIFDVPGTLPVISQVATPLGSPSSSSLNNTFATLYPETFQFDAYRMMTFHNDVSDLTIVYMLLLLFRQLCGTPLDELGPLPAAVGGMVQRQLKSIKGEIWCLLNDANLCLSSSGALPATPTAASGSSCAGRRAAGLDGKLFLGSAGGFAKLEHPRWRRAMQNVLLQIAARASAIQLAARSGSTDPTSVRAAAPSAKTQQLLNSWMDTNLRTGSALHKICQSRLRNVVLDMLTDKVRSSLQMSTAVAAAVPATGTKGADAQPSQGQQKRASPSEIDSEAEASSKRRRAEAVANPSTTQQTAGVAATDAAGSPWDVAMNRAGLEPFAAEIRLLSDRVAKVATFHLRVFRNLYEGFEAGRSQAAQDSS